MDYTLIIIVTIVVTTLFVHQLANRVFGIRLSMKPLALCALFSVCISLILPRVIVGFAGLAGTIGVLAVCAIVFAYFVVCYEETIEAKMSAASEQTLMSSFSRLNIETADRETTSNEGNAAYEGGSVCEQTVGDFDPLENQLAIEHQPIELLQPDIPELEADNFVADDGQFNSLTSITDEANDRQLNEDELADSTAIPVSTDEVVSSNINMTEVIDPVEKYGFSFLDNKSLDELLDFAFQQQEEKNFDHALFAFKNILKQFPSSTVAPFAVIEIGNLLKTRGAYDEAIQVFADAKTLPALQTENQFEKEFVNAIAHLRIIKNTLIHRRLGLLPFHQLPATVCEEIDTEFREWLKLTQI